MFKHPEMSKRENMYAILGNISQSRKKFYFEIFVLLFNIYYKFLSHKVVL